MTELFWTTEKRNISQLVGHPFNPRKMSASDVDQLRQSIEKFNFVEIPAIDLDNTILAGHQRLNIMRLLGRGNEEIDVRVPSRKLSDKERDEYLIRSNKNTGSWDFDVLANVFDESDLEQWGFTAMDIPTLDNNGPSGTGSSGTPADVDGIKTLSFKVSKEQAERIEEVLGHIQNGDLFKFTETFGNTNKDGNALYTLANSFNANIG